jgi:alanyl-tRNA synthetase
LQGGQQLVEAHIGTTYLIDALDKSRLGDTYGNPFELASDIHYHQESGPKSDKAGFIQHLQEQEERLHPELLAKIFSKVHTSTYSIEYIAFCES